MIACRLTALSAAERLRRSELLAALQAQARAVRELPDGFAFEFPGSAGTWMSAAEFITLERRCCPFLSFALEAESDDGPMRLHVTGPDGVKDFVASALCAEPRAVKKPVN